MLDLASYALRGGDPDRAARSLEAVVESSTDPLSRSRARLLLAPIRFDTHGSPAAVELCQAVLREGIADPEVLAEAHGLLSAVDDDLSRRSEHIEAAAALLEPLADPDPVVLALILGQRVLADLYRPGTTVDAGAIERVLELERRAPRPAVSDRFSAALGAVLKYTDDFDRARYWLERTYQSALDEGDDGSLPYALSHLPQLELWAGNWALAEDYARRVLGVSLEQEIESQRRRGRPNLAAVHVHQGRVDEARAELDEVIPAAEGDDDLWTLAVALPVLGLLELSLGNGAAAARHLRRATEARDAIGDESPRRQEPDLVESLVATGELDDAATFLERFLARARAHERHSAIANLARARGLLFAARGDLDSAVAALDEALAVHDLVEIPFDRARTLLAVGQVLRRRRERRAAKEALEAALAIFERLGAPIWAARTRDELDRLGLRRGAGDELTESERRVVELAASGQTNRQVADALFLSPKTVEAHLARAYGKLGITSRAELGAVIARESDGRSGS
jgi:DNA-binding CsgD family transcriptional regulator